MTVMGLQDKDDDCNHNLGNADCHAIVGDFIVDPLPPGGDQVNHAKYKKE